MALPSGSVETQDARARVESGGGGATRSQSRVPSGANFLVTTESRVSPTTKTLFDGSRSSIPPVVSGRVARQSSSTVSCAIAANPTASARHAAMAATEIAVTLNRVISRSSSDSSSWVPCQVTERAPEGSGREEKLAFTRTANPGGAASALVRHPPILNTIVSCRDQPPCSLCPYSPKCLEGNSVLKNSFALSCAPGSK